VDEETDFVHGFLTPAEGLLHDLDTAAAGRSVLVDPRTTPDAMLPWVASLAGLVLDQRWPERARRELVAEVFALYARRGTVGALERTLSLYLRRPARVVERWRLRGLGGAVLGLGPDGLDAPTVGGNTRATGMLGHFTVGGETPSSSSYRRFAHRFTVLVPGRLDDTQRVVVRDLVGRHKPAHTLGDVCELGDGLPVGRLRLGLTAYVGPRATRPTAVLGQARLGRGGTLGVPACGARVGESRVGRVRVG
jgi:phage tail-like protein